MVFTVSFTPGQVGRHGYDVARMVNSYRLDESDRTSQPTPRECEAPFGLRALST